MKKVCVTGKGGSGKSMLSVLLAKALAARGFRPVLVDADESNLGLQHMLGIDAAPKPLMAYLGGKSGIQKKMIPGQEQGVCRFFAGTCSTSSAGNCPRLSWLR